MHPEGSEGLALRFFLTTWWVGSVELEVSEQAQCALRLADRYASATDGTLTLTRFDADWIEGEYSLVFGLDGTVQGTFRIPILDTY